MYRPMPYPIAGAVLYLTTMRGFSPRCIWYAEHPHHLTLLAHPPPESQILLTYHHKYLICIHPGQIRLVAISVCFTAR